MKEIELKYLIKSQSKTLATFFEGARWFHIDTYYLFTDPGELRIVWTSDQGGKITVKSDGGLTRDEWEEELPQWAFDLLIQYASKYTRKTRFKVVKDDIHYELDRYHTGDPIWILEVEFPNEAMYDSWEAPDWLVNSEYVDVTRSREYKNKNLAIPVVHHER